MKAAILEITEDDAKGLIQLLDLAVKAGGLNYAIPATAWAMKLNALKFEEKEEK